MRWTFFSLLAINAVLFFWLSVQPEKPKEKPKHKIAAAQAAQEGEPLVLLSELAKSALKAKDPTKTRLKMPSGGGVADRSTLCTLVGPFERLLKAEYFVERLQALDLKASINEIEVPGEAGYWVYLSPQPSRKAALRRLQELQSNKVDSYVIPKGELTNGISFGMYSQRDRAEAREKEIRAMGYDAKIRKVSRTYKEIWVVMEPGEAAKVEHPLWVKLLNEQSGLERLQNICPTVASS